MWDSKIVCDFAAVNVVSYVLIKSEHIIYLFHYLFICHLLDTTCNQKWWSKNICCASTVQQNYKIMQYNVCQDKCKMYCKQLPKVCLD